MSYNSPYKEKLGVEYQGKGTWERPHTETRLDLWMKENGRSFPWMAKQIGASVRSVRLWAWGQVLPTLVFAFQIERVTAGEVPASYWLTTELGRAVWNGEIKVQAIKAPRNNKKARTKLIGTAAKILGPPPGEPERES